MPPSAAVGRKSRVAVILTSPNTQSPSQACHFVFIYTQFHPRRAEFAWPHSWLFQFFEAHLLTPARSSSFACYPTSPLSPLTALISTRQSQTESLIYAGNSLPGGGPSNPPAGSSSPTGNILRNSLGQIESLRRGGLVHWSVGSSLYLQ